MDEIDLLSVLEQPTQIRSEVESIISPGPIDDFGALEFESDKPTNFLENSEIEEIEEEEIEEEEPHDPELEAEKLLGLIQSANLLTMTPLAVWKIRKKRGGKAAISRMQVIAAKNFEGQTLDKKEAQLLGQYNAYLQDKEQLEKAIPYTEDELKLLKTIAVPYCKTSKMKINDSFAFWTTLAGIQATRIIAIIQA